MIYAFISQGGREYQQDAYCVFSGEDWIVAAISDGMGGHAYGEFASESTILCIKELEPRIAELISVKDIEGIHTIIRAAFQKAHNVCLESGTIYDNRGATLVVAFVYDNIAHFYNTGDSYGFLLNHNAQAVNVTVPHSQDGVITNCIGGYRRGSWSCPKKVTVDYFPVQLRKNERVILASDGIVDPDTACENLSKTESDFAKAIGEHGMNAYDATGKSCDNTTVIVIERQGV